MWPGRKTDYHLPVIRLYKLLAIKCQSYSSENCNTVSKLRMNLVHVWSCPASPPCFMTISVSGYMFRAGSSHVDPPVAELLCLVFLRGHSDGHDMQRTLH